MPSSRSTTRSRKKNSPDTEEIEIPETLKNSAGFLLNRLGRILKQRVSVALEPYELSVQELGVLRILDAYGSLSQQKLCATHHIDRTTMVHLIDGLEEGGYVLRATNSSDRRSYQVSLTPKGNKVLKAAMRQVKKIQAEFLSPLSDEEWQVTRISLLKLLEHNKPI